MTVLLVVGEAFDDPPVPTISLVDRFGKERAMKETLSCVEEAVRDELLGSDP